MFPIKSEDAEADKDADDIAMAAEDGGDEVAGAEAVAVAVSPLSSLIMVSLYSLNVSNFHLATNRICNTLETLMVVL